MRRPPTAAKRTGILHSEEQPSAFRTLVQLRKAEATCTRCMLYRFATQVVPGEGPARARLMLIGEQPGDVEDLRGQPFVGLAGRILDRALQEAQIVRSDVFITNAVKHFKHEMRGKRRLHKRPNTEEIMQCKLWLDHEMQIVRPRAVVAMGATAARSLFGRSVTISSARSHMHDLPGGSIALVTIHPSFLLRLQDDVSKEREHRAFIADLRRARDLCK